MIPGQTRRSAAYHRRPRVKTVEGPRERYFIYRLHDDAGQILYIGRSCDVPARIRAHVADTQGGKDAEWKRTWVPRIRRVSMVGPFTWAEACQVERAEIEAHQPHGNRAFTEAHGWPRSLHSSSRSRSPARP